MELKEFAFFNAQFNILLIIVQENVYLDVQITLIILLTGKVELVSVFVLKLIRQDSMQIMLQELVFQIALKMLMEIG
jgi:hypothetical protein